MPGIIDVAFLCCFACQVNIKVVATKNALHFFDKSALPVPVLGEQDEIQVICYLYTDDFVCKSLANVPIFISSIYDSRKFYKYNI